MRLKRLSIRNFRCYASIEIDIDKMHALVGSNGSGKSTVLRALDFFFNPSTKKISEESFYQRDSALRIEVEALFSELNATEKETLASYLRRDGSFHVMRTASMEADADDGDEEGELKIKILAHYCKPQPKIDWLNPANINSNSITEWWKEKEKLIHGGTSFADMLGTVKPKVGDWKANAAEFADEHLTAEDYEDAWIPNPQGYAGVLKATLPHFELIPAVRDAADESKVTKTNPFGRLIYEIIDTLDRDLRDEVDAKLRATTFKLNREGGKERAAKVAEVESTIQGFLAEMMPADLEIEFQAPTVEVLLTTPKVYVDDGFRGGIDGKGHGLQRAVIFSILRAYAKLVTQREGRAKRTLILGVEEPELYMHPTALRTIRQVLRTIAEGDDQVLCSTHNPLIVDVAYFDEIIRFEAPDMEDGKIPVGASPKHHQLPVNALVKDLVARHEHLKGRVTAESIRERYSHAYTASRNEGFFAKRVMLVEGQTELYTFPIYASAMDCDLDSLGVAVVECGGKDQMDRFYRVFNELGIVCYPVFDYDKRNNKEKNRKATTLLLELLNGADIEDPDIAQVRDGFSCFAENWETDLKNEIPDYDKLAAEARDFFGLQDDTGKPLVARYIAVKLTEQDPPVIPPTIRSIIEKALAAEHTGSCLKGQDARE